MERKKNGELTERRLHSLYYFVKYHRIRFYSLYLFVSNV